MNDPVVRLQKIPSALIELHKKLGKIHETTQGQYKAFADLSTIYSVVNPALGEVGLAAPQLFESDGENDYLVQLLLHESGETLASKTKLVRNPKKPNPTHDWGSSVTYQRRYALLNILGISPGIEDNDGSDQVEIESDISKPILDTPAQPQQDITITNPPLHPDDRKELLEVLANLYGENKSKFNKLEIAFRKEFPSCKGKMSESIQEPKHRDFIFSFLK